MSAPPLGLLLKALPPGAQRWIRVRGSSMWPLLWSGDQVRLLRGARVQRGDGAVLLRGDGALVTHVVSRTDPLETRGFLGPKDAPGLELLGAVDRVRRGTLEVPWARQAVWPLHLAAAGAQRSQVLRAAWHLGAGALFGAPTAPVRAPLLAVQLRTLDRSELAHFAVALSRFETLPADALETLLATGRVAVAEARGQVAGLLVRTAGGVLQHAHLARWAWGLGVERRLVGSLDVPELVHSARVHPRQQGFLAALLERGFREAALDLRSVTLER